MSVYVVGQISITDRERYDRYKNAFMDVLRQFGGTLLAADEAPLLIEGRCDYEKFVLFSFDDQTAFCRWMESPEYQRISIDRKAGSTGVILLIRGL
ncbi:MAG: DUF1330 domain-containing protein [Acidobacteria bacterium]|nr:DUF1330 domain-containing protein [Acidobacteriota bacterium]